MISRDNPDLAAINARRNSSPQGPFHFHVADSTNQTIQVRVGDQVLVTSERALILKEVGRTVYDPVYYFPKTDVHMDRLQLVAGKYTTCPIKGQASYWTYRHAGETIASLAWSYEDPIPYSGMIAGYIAFDKRYVAFEIAPMI